ncbi:MAG: hypothetical protein IPQ13_12165 [Holophagaceae bacterium]|nr:hypothetical protein [Holophagaceae bacterium]
MRQALGPKALLCGYPHPGGRRWLVKDELTAQAFSAGSLCVAGSLAMLCGHLAASPLALDLLSEAGWRLPDQLLVFRSTEELGALIRDQAAGGARLVASFPLPEDIAPAAIHLVEPSLRAFLNHKGNLERLVPMDQRPARRLMGASEAMAQPEACLHSAVKVATLEATGGGHDLLLPPHSGDAARLAALLDGAEGAVLEEFLSFRSTRCFNYLIGASGEPMFLGAPEQFLSAEGHYLGNWFRAEDQPDPLAVAAGAAICRRAAALGYRGAAGLDAGFQADGSFKFFDLNFRMNGSTAPLLLFPELHRRIEAPVALRTALRGSAPPSELAATLSALLKERRFFPLTVVLSDASAEMTDFLVSGFLPGSDAAEILETLDGLPRRLGCC